MIKRKSTFPESGVELFVPEKVGVGPTVQSQTFIFRDALLNAGTVVNYPTDTIPTLMAVGTVITPSLLGTELSDALTAIEEERQAELQKSSWSNAWRNCDKRTCLPPRRDQNHRPSQNSCLCDEGNVTAGGGTHYCLVWYNGTTWVIIEGV